MAGLKRGRAKRLVLDIGASAVRICELSRTKTGYQLTKYAQRDFPVNPAMEEEERANIMAETVQALLKELKIRQRKVIIGVPGQSVFTRTRQLPPVPEHKVTQIVRYEIQQQIPFSLDQIALDYQVLNRTEAGGYEVLMAAIKVDVVEKHVDIVSRVKRQIDSVDVYPIAAYNWLKHSGDFGEEGECVALVDVGASTTEIVIERDNQFRFTRSLNTGGNHITKAIAENFNMSFEEAEKLKRERGFAPTGDPARDGKGGEVIGKVLKRLVGEINRSFAFFRTQPGGGTVSRVVVTGGGACLRNMIPYLQRELGVEVRIAQPLAGLAIAPAAQEVNDHPEQAATVLGLSLRTLEKPAIELDLVPPRVLELARIKQQTFYWALSIATLGLILASIIPVNANKNELVEQQIATLERQLGQYDEALVVAPDPGAQSQYEIEFAAEKAKIEKLSSQFNNLNNEKINESYWLTHLSEVAASRPPKRVLISLFETVGLERKPPEREGKKRGIGQSSADKKEEKFGQEKKDYLLVRSFQGTRWSTVRADQNTLGSKREKAVAPPMRPNAIAIYGYAEDPETVKEYHERLKASGAFVEVYWDQATTDPVDLQDLQTAVTETTIGAGRTVTRSGDDDEEDTGGFGGLQLGGGGFSVPGATSGRAVGEIGVQMYTFEMFLQYDGQPIDRWSETPRNQGGGAQPPAQQPAAPPVAVRDAGEPAADAGAPGGAS